MPTIKDVAARASVSIATVSRVLNKKGKYTAETEDAVNRAARELGYIPNLTAKSLKTGLTGTIAMIVNEFFLLNYPSLINTAIKILSRQKYGVEVVTNADMGDCLHFLKEGKFDGLLIIGITNDDNLLKQLIETGQNFVFMGGGIEREDVNLVEIDYFQGGYLATQTLINHAHKQILFIEDSAQLYFTQEIKRGYLFALDENGIQYLEDLIVTGSVNRGETGELLGYSSVKNLLEKEEFSAILTTDDKLAFGALRALKEKNYRVPEDISIIGFGNLSMSGYFSPPLTSVEIPISQMGELGAEILVNNIKRKDQIVKRVKLKINFVHRESLSKRLTL